MKASDWVSLAALVACAAAVWYGVRRGRKNLARQLSTARAEGRAELHAELSASAVANGGSVVFNGFPAGPVGEPPVADIASASYEVPSRLVALSRLPDVALDDHDLVRLSRAEWAQIEAALGAIRHRELPELKIADL